MKSLTSIPGHPTAIYPSNHNSGPRCETNLRGVGKTGPTPTEVIYLVAALCGVASMESLAQVPSAMQPGTNVVATVSLPSTTEKQSILRPITNPKEFKVEWDFQKSLQQKGEEAIATRSITTQREAEELLRRPTTPEQLQRESEAVHAIRNPVEHARTEHRLKTPERLEQERLAWEAIGLGKNSPKTQANK